MMRFPGLRTVMVALIVALGDQVRPANAQPHWLACTAWGGSHTGRYTFQIDIQACSVYWQELDMLLHIQLCDPPRIRALKPFAPNRDFYVEFNLSTGIFADHANGRADRGRCTPIMHESKPH